MTARTHDVIAFASLISIATMYPPQQVNIPTVGAVLVGNIIGSLLPDLDQAGNRLWDITPLGNATGRFFRRVFISHRSISHSLLGLFIFYKLLQIILPIIFNPIYIDYHLVLIAIMIGYISHLLADLFTKEGLPLLFPYKHKFGIPPVKTLRITTSSIVENFIILPLSVGYLFWFIASNQTLVINLIRKIHS